MGLERPADRKPFSTISSSLFPSHPPALFSTPNLLAPLPITSTLSAQLTNLRPLFTYPTNFRIFVLKAKVSDDDAYSSGPSRSSSGSDITPSVTLAAVTDQLTSLIELYPKLKFAYEELITKENFVYSILGTEGLDYDFSDCEFEAQAMEAMLGKWKGEKKKLKDEMLCLVKEIERVSYCVGREWASNEEKYMELEKIVPRELRALENTFENQVNDFFQDRDELLILPMPETLSVNRKLELDTAAADIELYYLLEKEIPRKMRLAEKLKEELFAMEQDREELVGGNEKKGGKDGVNQERDVLGKWNKAVKGTMKQLLSEM